MSEKPQIPKEEYCCRLEQTQAALFEDGLEGLIIFSHQNNQEGNVYYLTNHRILPELTQSSNNKYAAYIMPVHGEGTLVAPTGYKENQVVNVSSVFVGKNLMQETIKALNSHADGTTSWGISGKDILLEEQYKKLTESFPAIKWKKADVIVNNQRLVKTESEIVLLQRAARIAVEGIRAGLESSVSGVTQEEVKAAARKACLIAGADEILQISMISGSTIHSSILSPNPQTILKDGEFIYLEVTGWAAGYSFDLSRVKVCGNPTDAQVDYMEHLAQATEWMIESMRPDYQTTFYHTESRGRTIQAQAHGIGLDIEENPRMKIKQSITLKQGMTLCVAPVVSSLNFGSMSIKEMIVMHENGPQILGNLPIRLW
jgi:Xaa-Pro aminopeptidase